MSGQRVENSRLCLAGFILSFMPVLLLPLVLMFGEYVYILFILLPLAGFIVSIIGLVTAKKEGRQGKVFGILGIVFPSIGAVVLFLFGLLIWTLGSDLRDLQKNEMYSMGGIEKAVNTEYDVSQYGIPKDYDLASLNIIVSDAEFKSYAGSKLETISSESDMSIKGTYRNYNFLIVRTDRLDDWLAINCPQGFRYNGLNTTISYGVEGPEWMVNMVSLVVYKDPSDKFIVITNCSDYKVISEFFE